MDTSIIVPGSSQVFLESGSTLGMEPGKLYKITSILVGQTTLLLAPEFLNGPLMYLKRVAAEPFGIDSHVLFLNADGMVLRLAEVVLAELLAQQLIIKCVD